MGTIRMPQVVGADRMGRVLNHKTAHSQLMGDIVRSPGMGVVEQTEWTCASAVR